MITYENSFEKPHRYMIYSTCNLVLYANSCYMRNTSLLLKAVSVNNTVNCKTFLQSYDFNHL